MQNYDIIVLTAANEAQAGGYRKQLNWRRENGLIPENTRSLVVADPDGRRVGSLGSTFFVLYELAEYLFNIRKASSFEELFRGCRILICHSGGDSRRTPAYAAQGKVFTPVPAVAENGAPLALFDLILKTLAELPAPEDGHVLVTSGDVLLTFDHASVDFSRPGVTGVAYFGSCERGSRHGVYVPSRFKGTSSRTVCYPVADFLQKPDHDQMRTAGAIDAFGHVAIDTGLVSFGPETVQKLMVLCGVRLSKYKVTVVNGILNDIISGQAPQMDIYEELLMALTPSFSEAGFVENFAGRYPGTQHKRRMRRFYRAVHDVDLNVNILPYCEFFHIGSSRELLSGFSGLSRTAREYGFSNGSGSALMHPDDSERAFVFNSYLNVPFSSGRSLLEAVYLDGKSEIVLDGDNILTGIPAECNVNISLPAGIGLVCLPVGRKKWTALAYGIRDDFKTPFKDGNDCLFLNNPVNVWMKKNSVPSVELWRDNENNGMWTARLWRMGELDDVLAEAVKIASGKGFKSSSRAGRYSISEILPKVNHSRLLEVRRAIRRKVGLLNVRNRLKQNNSLPAQVICDDIRSREDAKCVLRQLADLIESATPGEYLFKARVLKTASMIYRLWPDAGCAVCSQVADSEAAVKAAFQQISHCVALNYQPPDFKGKAAILHDQVVWVTTPVRIDFAGGWSDTPPVCTERGGTVLNAAITLNGLYPVQVMAKLNERNTIRLSSIDLGERQELTKTAQILDHHDPRDWAALAKAALILSGIVPDSTQVSLKKKLEMFGGGLDLTIFSSLPKGSGMGTSSILGSAVLACLDRVLGLRFSADRLIFMTSMLEQRMSTGGGWQDQVGGIMPGVKLIRTEPGVAQTVNLRWSVFDLHRDSDLKKRCLLYFTGQKRMARNLLQNVVGGYLARDPLILKTLDELKICALDTKEALDAQDIEGFCRGVNRYWELKKQIDPGSTNEPIEKLLALVQDDCSARLLPGAGGGGFIFIIAKDLEAVVRIKEKFAKHPPNRHARFFDFDIDQQGLKVTVL
ncbi:MAG: L-fucokinase [Kiritimatiellia bacterium]